MIPFLCVFFGVQLGCGPTSGMQFLIFTAAVGKLIAFTKIQSNVLGTDPDHSDWHTQKLSLRKPEMFGTSEL